MGFVQVENEQETKPLLYDIYLRSPLGYPLDTCHGMHHGWKRTTVVLKRNMNESFHVISITVRI